MRQKVFGQNIFFVNCCFYSKTIYFFWAESFWFGFFSFFFFFCGIHFKHSTKFATFFRKLEQHWRQMRCATKSWKQWRSWHHFLASHFFKIKAFWKLLLKKKNGCGTREEGFSNEFFGIFFFFFSAYFVKAFFSAKKRGCLLLNFFTLFKRLLWKWWPFSSILLLKRRMKCYISQQKRQ